jgi:hypothetical protein
MKYYKRLRKYKASNLEYCIDTKISYSYEWWQFTKLLSDGKTILFNNYSYSSSTSRHQSKIASLFREAGYYNEPSLYNIVYVSSPKSIGATNFYQSCVDVIHEKINAIESILQNNRRKRSLDVHRYEQLNELRLELAKLTKLKPLIEG